MKSISIAVVAAIGATVAAAGWYTHGTHWGEEARRIKKAKAEQAVLLDRVRRELKDPDSAQFRVYVQRADYLCGEVNAKNSLGGYVGYKYFVVDGVNVNFSPDAYTKLVGKLYHCQ